MKPNIPPDACLFNLVTDFASHPPESNRLRRNRPALERMAGAWLRRFRIAAKRTEFTVAKHIEELAGDPPSIRQTAASRGGISEKS